MRVITFSKVFPKKHPRQGEPTYFVEKIWKGLYEEPDDALYSHECGGIWSGYKEIENTVVPKGHTIRAGNRWKVGDLFAPRIWSDKPYRSKQIQFAPPIEIKKIWNFEKDEHGFYFINGGNGNWSLEELAKNDGLSVTDFDAWFYYTGKSKNGFNGQIICWAENINYQ